MSNTENVQGRFAFRYDFDFKAMRCFVYCTDSDGRHWIGEVVMHEQTDENPLGFEIPKGE